MLQCTAEPGDAGAPAPAVAGADCDPVTVCAAGLLCVDGRCSVRPWPPDASAAADVVTPIDLGVVSPVDIAPDVPPAADTVADTGAPDVPATTRVMLGEHDGLEAPSDDAVTLQLGQASVAELASPVSGRLVSVEVIAVEPPGGTACGVFRVVTWSPGADGAWPLAPTWTGPDRALVGSDAPQTLLEPAGPALGTGPLRVGLLFVANCPSTPHPPRVVIDASGETSGSWLWAQVGANAVWIAGTSLGLSGRWALRAGVEVP